MRTANNIPSVFKAWNKRLPTFGQLALASFYIALISGVLLAIPYDIEDPAKSLQLMHITSFGALFIRSLHFWSGHIFLVSTILHFVEYFLSYDKSKTNPIAWAKLILTLMLCFFIMLSGFILRGDNEALMARSIFSGLIHTLPFYTEQLSIAFLGSEGDFQILYVHHIASATLLALIFIIEHARIVWPNIRAWLIMLASQSLLSLMLPPKLFIPSNPEMKGPWYFVGIQELLHWLPKPAILFVILGLLGLALCFYPFLKNSHRRFILVMLSIVLLLYLLLSIIGHFFRGAGWQWV